MREAVLTAEFAYRSIVELDNLPETCRYVSQDLFACYPPSTKMFRYNGVPFPYASLQLTPFSLGIPLVDKEHLCEHAHHRHKLFLLSLPTCDALVERVRKRLLVQQLFEEGILDGTIREGVPFPSLTTQQTPAAYYPPSE